MVLPKNVSGYGRSVFSVFAARLMDFAQERYFEKLGLAKRENSFVCATSA